MAIDYGFFNSKNGDRKYNSEQISQYFKGLLSGGVLANVSDGLQVYSNGGMEIKVKPGRAFDSKHHWMENNTDYVISLSASSVNLNRIDRIVVKFDVTEEKRNAEIIVKEGTPGTTPIAPNLLRTDEIEEYCLAEIYIGKNVEEITQSAITDTRPDNNICGWVTGLIEQVDTSTLYEQWRTSYNEYYEEATASFESWVAELQTILDENVAGNLLNLINENASNIEANSQQITQNTTDIATKASTETYTATLTSSGWSSKAPYTQTVTVTGILTTDNPVIDVVLSTTTSTALNQLEAWGNVSKIVTGANSITATCLEDKPEVDIPIQIKVVR